MDIAEKKRQLERKLYELEQQEKEKKDQERRQKNYERFLNRPEDWVVGKAHAEYEFHDNGGHHPKGVQLPYSINVHGNMGHTYIPTASVSHDTNTYFHNVWTDKQRKAFEKALEKVVHKEIAKIAKSLRSTLELMGLQSNHYYLTNEYPKDKIKEIDQSIWAETCKVLDRFKDKDFTDLFYRVHGWRVDGYGTPFTKMSDGLSHSRSIVKRYLKEHRPKLYAKLYGEDN